MAYKFLESFVGLEYEFKPRDVIDGPPLSPGDIARCIERGILVEVDAPEKATTRTPVKEKAISRKAAKAEKTIL